MKYNEVCRRRRTARRAREGRDAENAPNPGATSGRRVIPDAPIGIRSVVELVGQVFCIETDEIAEPAATLTW